MKKINRIPKQYRKLFVRYGEEKFPNEIREIIIRADELFDIFKKETPDIGGKKNMMAGNLDMAMAFFAFYEASGKRVSGEDVLTMAGWMTEGMDVISKIFNFNKPRLGKIMYKFYGSYAKKANENKANGSWANTWGVKINPEGHEEGCSFHLVGCPLVDFAKKHGYMEIMPYLCRTDHITARLMHAKLIRHHTVAEGYECCDYWYVGDESEIAKKYADIKQI